MASAYSRDQVVSYLNYIGLPQDLHNASPTLAFLQQLHTYTISKLPYENLSLHYNPSHSIDVDPQHLFTKIVTNNRGRGGYCMEIALLYNHILCALGFDAYTAGVRTRPRVHGTPTGDFPGWSHIVNIIAFPDGSKFHDDVAFGGDGPTMPMPLEDGRVHHNLGTQEIRLVRDWIPTQSHRTDESRLWIYQYRNQPTQPWLSFYAFPELEFMPLDWGVLNHWMNTHPDSNHRQNLLIVKFLRRECEDHVYGKIMMVNNLVRRNLGGKTETVQTLETEEKRVDALKHWFGITLTEDETKGIESSPRSLA
ncbi:hypothetical protein M409DRAFT_24641 [Zasmidium cellare ATCC 36951]|uniref:Uncharacterized protein n=1 Tax=Zasmidium cellare ATCC 36951 TaxID=1080233 RepID=A0A6A6CGF8_ZASCE|nr:uncharacterized protein M409DRAFT_24641 [Zasmidium cellare ATCC 36951]KAF2165258.1 hypothetical protein M409DRAFT_24641 [Zasmidium cellare ATCC 36951]